MRRSRPVHGAVPSCFAGKAGRLSRSVSAPGSSLPVSGSLQSSLTDGLCCLGHLALVGSLLREVAAKLARVAATGTVRVVILSFCRGLSVISCVVPKSKLQCDIRTTFATAFQNWRLKNNIPLKRIAKDLGVSVATVSSWEMGTRFPTACNFEMLVSYTGVPPCRLFCVMANQCVPTECRLAMGQES